MSARAVADLIDTDPITLTEVYGHHALNFQSDAAEAIGRA